MVAGCETEKDPVVEPLGPFLHLTDGTTSYHRPVSFLPWWCST